MAQWYRIVCANLLLAAAAAGGPAVHARPSAAAPEPVAAPAADAEGEAYGRLMRAVLIARRGEFREAVGEVRQAIALQPDAPDLLVVGADLMLWMGRRQEAEELCHRALELDPTFRPAIRFLADLEADRALGNRPDEESRAEAIRLYRELIRLGDEEIEVLRRLISLYLQAGDRIGAQESAERLIALRPGDARATELLVRLKADQGKQAEALRHALEFVAHHPEEGSLLQLAEQLARELDAWDMVVDVFAIEDGFGDRPVAAQRLRAEALIQLDRADEAAAALERARAYDPSDTQVRFNLAAVYRRIGRFADAKELAVGLADETPRDTRNRLLLAEILEAQGDERGALEAFGTALEGLVEAGQPEALAVRETVRARMILLLIGQDRFDEAETLLQQLEVKERPEAVELAGELAMAREDWDDVRLVARQLRGMGESGGADMLEAEMLIRSGRWAKAEPKVEEAVAVLGPGARVRLAALYLDAGQRQAGEALLREWVERDAKNADAHFQLGAFLYTADDLEAAEVALRDSIELNPRHAAAMNFLGYSFAERGERLDEALSLIQRALAVDGRNGAYLDSLGWALYQMQRYDEAREPLERAAREYPTDPVVLEHLGDVYARLGQRELAVSAWSRALDAGPQDAEPLRAKIAQARSAAEEEESVARSDAGAEPAGAE
jgi:tetratricopeptide (TPR) repeat protein